MKPTGVDSKGFVYIKIIMNRKTYVIFLVFKAFVGAIGVTTANFTRLCSGNECTFQSTPFYFFITFFFFVDMGPL